MTIINPNSISGIVSVTATSNALHFYESDGDKLNINADLTGNVTGNITGTTATFSGDVTVGGVLTYDDVTNIDSVGVITARSGLHVTSGSVAIGTDTSETNFLTTINGDLSLGEKNGVDNTFIDQKQNGSLEIINSGRTANNGAVRINRYNNISGDTTYFRDFVVYDGKETALLTVDGSSGNIGIGTDNPDYGLHVFGAGDILIEDSANGSAHLRLRSSNNGTDVSNWKVKTSSNNFLYIENDTVGGAPAFTIDNSAKIGIKDATPSVSLDLASTTDAVALPQGTTAQRPTGSAPYIRKNTTNNALEYYDGTSWVEIITDYFPTGSVILG